MFETIIMIIVSLQKSQKDFVATNLRQGMRFDLKLALVAKFMV